MWEGRGETWNWKHYIVRSGGRGGGSETTPSPAPLTDLGGVGMTLEWDENCQRNGMFVTREGNG